MAALLTESVITLRAMQESDLPAVLGVEQRAYSVPWTEGIFRDCLRVRYFCMVAELTPPPGIDSGSDGNDQIIGHAVMSIAAGECHVLNVCVQPDLHNRGIGRRMLRRLLALARRQEADTAFLEVRASNVAAIALYYSEGFDEVGLRRGYYPVSMNDTVNREDAVVMARAL
jgi:ribosomal-protein-alanine N-acetyltransferase